MNPEREQLPTEADAEESPARGSIPPPPSEEALAILRRMERILDEMRGRLESTARTERHQEFSFPRLVGALCQAVVVGLVIVALAGWAYRLAAADQLVALALAGVLQLGALTAFMMARSPR